MIITISGEIHSSKNSRQIHRNQKTGRTFVAKSKSSKADEEMLWIQLLSQKDSWNQELSGASTPYYVGFYFIRATKRRWDFANLVQGVADAMVKAGYLEDDDVEHFIPVYAGHCVDKENPGVKFWIA